MFRRRNRRPAPAPDTLTDVRAVIVPEDAQERRERELGMLRAIAAEGVIRQDEAEALLEEIRERRPLAELAPRGGRLASRFVSLRGALPQSADPQVERYAGVLRMVFDHHALMISSSLDLLAVDWRSERMAEQLDRLDGLGAPARWLEAVRAELIRGVASPP